MPSRRATLVALASTSIAGCAAIAPAPPALDDLDCPPVDLAFDPDRVVCATEDSDGAVGVSLGPPRVVSDDPESLDAVAFRIRNDASDPIAYRRSDWRLYRHDGWQWRERTISGIDERRTVPSGNSHTYAGLDSALGLGATGPTPRGTYALVVPATLGDERLALVAAFRVEG